MIINKNFHLWNLQNIATTLMDYLRNMNLGKKKKERTRKIQRKLSAQPPFFFFLASFPFFLFSTAYPRWPKPNTKALCFLDYRRTNSDNKPLLFCFSFQPSWKLCPLSFSFFSNYRSLFFLILDRKSVV